MPRQSRGHSAVPASLCPWKTPQEAEGPPGKRVQPVVTRRPVRGVWPPQAHIPVTEWVIGPCGELSPALPCCPGCPDHGWAGRPLPPRP